MRWLLNILFGPQWMALREDRRDTDRDARTADSFAKEVVDAVCRIPLANWSTEGTGAFARLVARTRGGANVSLRCHTDWTGDILFALIVEGEPIRFVDTHRERKAARRLYAVSDAVHQRQPASSQGETGASPNLERSRRESIRRKL